MRYVVEGVATQIEDPFALVGTKLDGQYRIDAVVGEGGYGVVYRGWHLALEQPIAIKALKVVSAEDPRVQQALYEKFKEEAKLLYTLSQSSLHIVRSTNFGAVNAPSGLWAPYMVLEWLEGRSFAEDLARRRKQGLRGRTLDEAFAILEPAAEGLGIAHQRRVAHRDVKPANFFLLDAQDGPRVKVLDFGIAKLVRDGEGPGTRSPFSSFTWLYAAPEQLDPRVGQTGLETDVYSFALVLSELLTDRPPVEARDVITILKASTDPTVRPTPRQRGANVPDAIEVVCRRALAVDPKARFANIGEFWAALASAKKSLSPDASGRHTATPPTKPSEGQQQAPVPTPMAVPSGSMQHSASAQPPAPMPMTSMQAPNAPYGPALPQYAPPPPAMSPPPMLPPPGVVRYGQSQLRPIPQASSAPLAIAIVGIVISLMFATTCAVVHAACG